jgi:hypothetical protein
MNPQARKECRRVKIYVYRFLNSAFNGGDYSASRSSRSNLEVLPLTTDEYGSTWAPRPVNISKTKNIPFPRYKTKRYSLVLQHLILHFHGTFFYPEDGISTRYSDIPLLSPSPHSVTRTPLSILDVTHWQCFTDKHFFIPPCSHLRCVEPVYCSIYVTLCCVLWAPGCWTQWKESNWLWYSFVLCIMERESKYVYHQLFYWYSSFMIIALLCFMWCTFFKYAAKLGKKSRWLGFCEPLSARNDAALSFKKNGGN